MAGRDAGPTNSMLSEACHTTKRYERRLGGDKHGNDKSEDQFSH
jgi:hypothetical protein